MITIIGGGFAGLSAAYFLHRAGKDVTLLEWSRGLGGRASTRNIGYRTVDAGAQRIDFSPLSSNPVETQARELLRQVGEERGLMPHLKNFPEPVLRFDGRSLSSAEEVEPNWQYVEGGMRTFAEALVKGVNVRTHTRISDIIIEPTGFKLMNQRGETSPSDEVIVALPSIFALALMQPHMAASDAAKKVCELLAEVQYEPMVGAVFGTPKIDLEKPFSALFTDDVVAPIFWLSREGQRRSAGVRANENAFLLQLGAEISREYILKTDSETFAAIERVFEDVLDVALPDVRYGEIQRWPAAFLDGDGVDFDTINGFDFGAPLHFIGDYVIGQSSIASAFLSGKKIADKILGVDASKFIAEPVMVQEQLTEAEWGAPVPTPRAPRQSRPNRPRKQPRGGEKSAKGGARREGDKAGRESDRGARDRRADDRGGERRNARPGDRRGNDGRGRNSQRQDSRGGDRRGAQRRDADGGRNTDRRPMLSGGKPILTKRSDLPPGERPERRTDRPQRERPSGDRQGFDRGAGRPQPRGFSRAGDSPRSAGDRPRSSGDSPRSSGGDRGGRSGGFGGGRPNDRRPNPTRSSDSRGFSPRPQSSRSDSPRPYSDRPRPAIERGGEPAEPNFNRAENNISRQDAQSRQGGQQQQQGGRNQGYGGGRSGGQGGSRGNYSRPRSEAGRTYGSRPDENPADRSSRPVKGSVVYTTAQTPNINRSRSDDEEERRNLARSTPRPPSQSGGTGDSE